ncbi:MAG: hotdog fold thioesterase [Planctomycetota bacterium]
MSDPAAAAELARRVVDQMLEHDAFSRWLGLTVSDLRPGHCLAQMTIRPDMVNGFGVCHGGVPYSLADSALAFASNSHGRLSLLIESNMSYPEKVQVGDVLTATADEVSCTNRLGTYNVAVRNQHGTLIGQFRGTVYRTAKDHFPAG